MRASLTRLAVALALAVSLAGCGGANPKPSPVVESSATPSPSASGAPTMPAEAKGTDAEAAKAFVQHYLAVLSYATSTGDVSDLKRLGLDSCKSCQNVIAEIERLYGVGGSASGEGYTAQRFNASNAHGIWTLNLTINAAPQTIVSSKSAKPSTSPDSQTRATFHLITQDEGWVVRDWTRT
ncbi:MAG: hypothetical protein JWO46_3221 [Nocardioidaceae bacterium]|nr:hypothetical protein [Nocardioidaceae bacterium]